MIVPRVPVSGSYLFLTRSWWFYVTACGFLDRDSPDLFFADGNLVVSFDSGEFL
jgi:hypothetical protein